MIISNYMPIRRNQPWLADGDSADNCVAAWVFKGAASKVNSLIDLTGNGHNLTDGDDTHLTSWDATKGIGSNGVYPYLVSDVTPPNNQSSWSVLARFSEVTASGLGCLFGSQATAQNWYWFIRPYNGVYREYCNGSYYNKVPYATSGVIGFAGNTAYYNGAPDGTIPSHNGTAIQIYVLAIKDSVVGTSSRLNGKLQALFIYNVVKNDTKMSALTTAMAAL